MNPDTRPRGISSGALRAIGVLFLVTVAMFGANLLFTSRDFSNVQRQQATLAADQGRLRHVVLTDCRFYRDVADLAALKVTLNPATRKASKVGIEIIAAGRIAWRGHGCPGHIRAPSPSFMRWARYYRIPAS